MTDARFPERWISDRRLLRLTDAEHRSFVTALAWAVSNRTDGRIDRDDLSLIPGCRPESASAMVAAGLWDADGSGWCISDFSATQTSSHELEVLENVRRANREAQARARAKKKAGPDPDGARDSQPDVSLTGEPDDIGRQERQERQALEAEGPTEVESTEDHAVMAYLHNLDSRHAS